MNKGKYLLFGALCLFFPLASCGPAPGPKYAATVTSQDTSKGTVSGSGSYVVGSKVTVYAVPKASYYFEGWYENDIIISNATSYSFTMPDHDVSYIAKFKASTYIATITSDDETKGTVTGGGSYTYGSQVNITATPKAEHFFLGWYENDVRVSNEASYSFIMPGKNITYVGKFSKNIYSAIITSEDTSKGRVTGSGSYEWSSQVTIQANPKTGYDFEGWYQNNVRVSQSAIYTFSMPKQDVSYVAKFTKHLFNCTITSEDTSKGTVTGSGNYPFGYQVTITATPNVGYVFEGWYDENDVKIYDLASYTFSMPTGDISYVAKFSRYMSALTVTSEDTSKGTVTGSGSYVCGSQVTIKASPNVGYCFDGWYENDEKVSDQASYSFKMPENDVSYVAKFKIPSFTLTVTSEDTAKGTVSGGGSYVSGHQVTINAFPKEGYYFDGWYEKDFKVSDQASYSFKMPENNVNYIAKFKTSSFTATVTSEDLIRGTVTGGGSYVFGAQVTITATPNEGYSFEGWYQNNVKVTDTKIYSFNMPGRNVSYVAKFSGNIYTATVTSEDTSKGTVTGSGSYACGSEVNIKATPRNGYVFLGWYVGNIKVSDSLTYSFKMPSNDVSYVAKFSQQSYTATITSNDETKGTVSGGGSYAYGSKVTAIAMPIVNATITNSFEGWFDENDKLISKEKEYVIDSITQNITLKAHFKSFSLNADFTFQDVGNNNVKVSKYKGTNGEALIPDIVLLNGELKKVVAIGNEAFYNCSTVTSVVIPNGVTLVGTNAFYGCSKLNSVIIPDSVTSIEKNAFRECSSLKTVFIPDSVNRIGEEVFCGCSSLTTVNLPNGISSIEAGLFTRCSSLTSIIIPNSVTLIEDYAFSGCTSFTSIIIPNSVDFMGKYVFEDCSSMTDIYCEKENKPSGWDNEWLGECEAKVHWGYRP